MSKSDYQGWIGLNGPHQAMAKLHFDFQVCFQLLSYESGFPPFDSDFSRESRMIRTAVVNFPKKRYSCKACFRIILAFDCVKRKTTFLQHSSLLARFRFVRVGLVLIAIWHFEPEFHSPTNKLHLWSESSFSCYALLFHS